MIIATAAGLDLSLTGTGIALADGHLKLITTREKVTTLPVKTQLQVINGLVAEIREYLYVAPLRLVVIEGLDMSNSYGASEQRVWLWGKVVEHLMFERKVQVFVAPSPRVKMFATGSGAAKKGEVIEAVTRRWPKFEHGGNDNLADAAAMAMMAAAILDRWDGREVDLPKANLRALAADNVVRNVEQAPPPRKAKR